MNKRPIGTRVLSKAEHDAAAAKLKTQKQVLASGIEQMSVTLYTTRAQNQMRGFVSRMDEIDRALTVFERTRVFIRDW
jgi:hypothetical protein